MSFRGSGVIVTGAGSGIGRAAALRFAAEGAGVVVADLNGDGAAAVVEEIADEGGRAVAVVGDLAEQAVVDRVVEAAVESFGGVDVLVNNAGIMDGMTAVHEVTDEEWDRVIRVNLTAPFLLARAVVPHMLARGKGAIVNTASQAALRGSAAGTAYTASKHGVVGLTKSMAVMYRGSGIRTNAVAPGATMTAIAAEVARDGHGPAALRPYLGNFGRVSRPDEQAAVIVFLASDAASNLNGVVLPVDNGWSAV
ncbi:MAG: glucose 1-dehydrogenase [Umezawaea sp.]